MTRRRLIPIVLWAALCGLSYELMWWLFAPRWYPRRRP
jgi:hypothetical protein